MDISVIIPSRTDQYLNHTINDLLKKAEGEIEVIVVLDGYWPSEIIENNNVVYVRHGTIHDNLGMREGINRGIAVSHGKYVMKIDEHCMVEQGFDKKLLSDIEDNWVVIPRRLRLDPEKWEIIEDGRPPIDYMYLEYPYRVKGDITQGLHGAEWRERYEQRKDILLDDTMSWQGSCWIMSRKWWDFIGELDSDLYGDFTQEAQEIGNKTWLGGGRLVVNKKTWYAHFHKGKHGKGYGFSTEQYVRFCTAKEKGRKACINYWFNNKWEKRIHDFEWLINKFWPLPHWPENWKEQIKVDEQYDYSKVGKPSQWIKA
jgi:glycosyltransferase involved in cell wall biosynthesis